MSIVTDFSGIEKVVWDFDNVHWKFKCIPGRDLETICDQEKAKIAVEIFPCLDFDQAVRMSQAGYRKYLDSFKGFLDLAQKTGVSEEELVEALFSRYHRNLYKRLKDEYPQIFAPSLATITAFQRLNGQVEHVILTHACADNFVWPFTQELKIAHYINQVIDYRATGFTLKGAGPYAINMAIGNTDPSKVVFAEDTIKHLQVAKEAFPEIKTVLVDEEIGFIPDGVDLVISSPEELLNKLSCVSAPQYKVATPFAPSL